MARITEQFLDLMHSRVDGSYIIFDQEKKPIDGDDLPLAVDHKKKGS